MSIRAITLAQQFRRLSGPGAAMLASFLAFGFSALVAALGAQVTYYQVVSTLGDVFHVSGIVVAPPAWVAPLLVDLSAVSPTLCTFVALCTAAGAVRLTFWPTGVPRASRFPFPAPYRGFFVMFGLVGTLTGFTIAFAPLDAATLEQEAFAQSQLLLAGLATALYSTLVAVLLAYGVCPLVEGTFRTLHRMRTGERAAADSPTALQDLTRQAERAASSLAELKASAAQAARHLDLQELAGRLGQLQALVDSIAAQYTEIAKRSEADRSAWTQDFDGVRRQLRALDDRVERTSIAERRNAERLEGLEARVDGFIEGLRGISS